MFIWNHRPTAIEKLKLKEWQKSMTEISDGEIISINPNLLENETDTIQNLPEVINNGGLSEESR